MKGARMKNYAHCHLDGYVQPRRFEETKEEPFLLALFHKWCDITFKAAREEEERQKVLTSKARKIAHDQFNPHKQPFVRIERWIDMSYWPDINCSKKRNLVDEIAWHIDRCEHGCQKEFNKECFKRHHFGWEN
jgi:hypothetical protein